MSADSTNVPKVGAFVLETLTTGMYTNPLDALREYVQNAFDSVQNAIRLKKLEPGAARIELFIDEKRTALRIHDNGLGISREEVASRLINVGMSGKTMADNAGFRGIGRLAGIAYCQRLVFRTRSEGENELHEVIFRCNDLRNSMSPGKEQNEEVADVLQRHTETKHKKTQKGDPFFEVEMEGIKPEGRIFLEWQKIQTYLAQVAPVGFDSSSFAPTGEIYAWLKSRAIALPEVSLKLHAGKLKQEVFKPYQRLVYKTRRERLDINVKGVRFYPDNAKADSPFWLWYAETNLPGMYEDDAVCGFRLRKNNIALGMDERMTEIFAEVSDSNARFNSYFMGEVYIQSPDTIPNARRDGFEDGAAWIEIRKELVKFAEERSREIREASKERSMDIEKLLRPVEKQLVDARRRVAVGFASKDERESFDAELGKSLEKLARAAIGERNVAEVKRLDETRKRLIETKENLKSAPFISQKLNTALDRKQRKVISEIIELLHQVLDASAFERARDAIASKYSLKEEFAQKDSKRKSTSDL